jgi:hypothetical protein
MDHGYHAVNINRPLTNCIPQNMLVKTFYGRKRGSINIKGTLYFNSEDSELASDSYQNCPAVHTKYHHSRITFK